MLHQGKVEQDKSSCSTKAQSSNSTFFECDDINNTRHIDDNILVSIIVPVYNSEQFLKNMLDSLLGQTYQYIQIICVNDGSKDSSLEILRNYENRDSRMVVIDKKNEGAGAARNHGLKKADGKYLLFIDSDDFIEKDCIERLLFAAEKNQTDIVVFGLDHYDNKTGEFFPNPWAVSQPHIPVKKNFYANDIDHIYKHLIGYTVNKFYLSSFLTGLELQFPSIGAHEDMSFTYTALSAAHKIFYLDKILYHYRCSRQESLSATSANNYWYMFDALDILKTELTRNKLWSTYERNFSNYVLHMCAWKCSKLHKLRRLEFRDSCRTHWFHHFNLHEHKRDYFFDEGEYHFLEDTLNMSLLRKVFAKVSRIFIAHPK